MAGREPADLDGAESWYHEALVLAEEIGSRPMVAACHLELGRLYHHMGGPGLAEGRLVEARAMFADMGMGSRPWSTS